MPASCRPRRIHADRETASGAQMGVSSRRRNACEQHMPWKVHREPRLRAIQASQNSEVASRPAPDAQIARVKARAGPTSIWFSCQLVWRISQTRPPEYPV